MVREWAEEPKQKADREEYDRLMREAYRRSPEYQLKSLHSKVSDLERTIPTRVGKTLVGCLLNYKRLSPVVSTQQKPYRPAQPG